MHGCNKGNVPETPSESTGEKKEENPITQNVMFEVKSASWIRW